MWSSIAKLLPQENVIWGGKVTALDIRGHQVVLNDGRIIKYKHCISTMPLDITLHHFGRDDLASRLEYSSSHIIGIGLRGNVPHGRKCWFYFPEDNCEFYRVTCFSTYAEGNTPPASKLLPTLWVGNTRQPSASEPKAGPYWSLMFEINESKYKPVKLETIFEDTIRGAIAVNLLTESSEIVSLYHSRINHGFPTPTVHRDSVLDEALPLLKAHNFMSRGRFGGYKYEVSNQDHSVTIGVEAVDHILFGTAEVTHSFPQVVGRSRNNDLAYNVVSMSTDIEAEDAPVAASGTAVHGPTTLAPRNPTQPSSPKVSKQAAV